MKGNLVSWKKLCSFCLLIIEKGYFFEKILEIIMSGRVISRKAWLLHIACVLFVLYIIFT